ncbi:MAG: hypothetical protein QW559_01100 [Candidatus Woesearchaeota archaeon]
MAKETKDRLLRGIVGAVLLFYSLPGLFISGFYGGMMMGRMFLGTGGSFFVSILLALIGVWLLYDAIKPQ